MDRASRAKAHRRAHGPVTISQLARATPAKKKMQQLRQREAERRARLQAEVEAWFEQFDANGDGKLQREELRGLLTWLHPSHPPTDANLGALRLRATCALMPHWPTRLSTWPH